MWGRFWGKSLGTVSFGGFKRFPQDTDPFFVSFFDVVEAEGSSHWFEDDRYQYVRIDYAMLLQIVTDDDY